MKTLAVFAGSKDLPTVERQERLDAFLDEFFGTVSGKIEKIIYGAGRRGVMGRLFEKSRLHGVPVVWYGLKKYQGTGLDHGTEIFEHDDERIEAFYRDGDAFLALPGGFGTIKETLQVNELIKRAGSWKKIYVPPVFDAFYDLVAKLQEDGMIADEDRANFVTLDDLGRFPTK